MKTENEKIKSQNKIIFYNIASTLILQGVNFFTGPIFASVLGTENYGIVSVYSSYVQLASIVLPLQTASLIGLARMHFPLEKQKEYQSSVISLSTILYFINSGIIIVISYLDCFNNLDKRVLALGLLQGWGLYIVSAVNSKYTYEFSAGRNFVLSLVVALSSTGSSLFLISFFSRDENYLGKILGQTVAYVLVSVFLVFTILREGKKICNIEYWKFTIPIAVPTVFHLLANVILNESDKIMLKWMKGSSEVGMYSLAYGFALIINAIWATLNNSWVPFYYEYIRTGQINEMKKHAKNYVEFFSTITIVFILLSRDVYSVYAPSEYHMGEDLIPIIALGYYFIFLYSFPVNYEFYRKATKTIAMGTFLAAIINIILNVLFIELWGSFGAAVSTVISNCLQFLVHFVCAVKIGKGGFHFTLRDFIVFLLLVTTSVGVSLTLADARYIRWGVSVILGIIIGSKIIRRRALF